MAQDLSSFSARELLRLHANIGQELRARGIVRSSNNPAADLAEKLFCDAFGWSANANSTKGADAVCASGYRYQIKSRRLTAHNRSRQLSAMRGLDKGGFDFLAGILFEEDYGVKRAALIPHALVLANAAFVEHTNSWKFYLVDPVWGWSGVRDVTDALRQVRM